MNELEIKQLLREKFGQDAVFTQTEFNSFGGSSRADFVVLKENQFIYYEIKTEKDNFSRLGSQISNAIGLFTRMYVVGPMNKMAKLRKLNFDIGLISEDRIGGWVMQEQKYDWKLNINKVKDILWASDLRDFISRRNPNFKRASKTVTELQKEFLELYDDTDCFKILNEVLPIRKYDIREHNGSNNI